MNMVKVGDRYMLMSENGRFAVLGAFRLVDVWNGKEIKTIADTEDLNSIDLVKIGIKDEDLAMLAYGSGKTIVTIFIDPYCKHCHKMIEQMGTMKDQYTFRLVMAPVLGKDSVMASRKLVCEKDKEKALKALLDQKFDGIIEGANCNLGPLQKTLLMAKFFGITGVPFTILPSTKTFAGETSDLKGLLENDAKNSR